MKQNRIKRIILLIVCIFASSAFAQDNFINYTTKDGLPSNQVYDIYQDKNGIIWFASDRGISSFNGSFFTNYSTLDGLLSDVVFDFYPQKNGTIWCSTEKNKIFIFDPIKLSFQPFKFNHLIPDYPGSEIKGLLTENGDFFLRFKGMTGYLKITSEGKAVPHQLRKTIFLEENYYLIHLKRDFYYYSTLNAGAINKLPLSGANRDMIVKNGKNTARIGFEYLDIIDETKKVNRIRLIKSGELLHVGRTGRNFWVSGYNIGVKILDSTGRIHQSYLEDLPCSNFFKDQDDGVWISTLSNGVYYYPLTEIKLLGGFQNENITSLSTSGVNVAFGTHTSRVINYSFATGSFEENKSSSNGMVRFYNGKLFSNIINQENEILIGFVRRFSENQTKPLLSIGSKSIYKNLVEIQENKSLDEIYDGDFIGNGLLLSQGTCIKLFNEKKEVIDSIDLHTITLDVDYLGTEIYCATSNRGLLILDKKLKIIRAINQETGLKSNHVNDVKVAHGAVWLATRNGITRIKNIGTKEQQISTISVANGLSDQEVSDFDFIGDTIFVGTRRGLNYFRITNWDKIVGAKASIFFSVKKISNQGEVLVETVDLPHYKNDLTFEIELATFKLNKEILFRYKLEGVDKNWTITRSRIINFKSLPPGEYELLIQANVNDYWNEKIIRQKIQILPPWFTSWWFIIAIVLLIMTIIWLFFKYRILNYNREIIREILRQALKRIKKKENVFIVRSNGRDIKIASDDVLYVESSRNYVTIYTTSKKVVIREKISNFLGLVPDPQEYIQIKRSIIVRIDQISSKSKDSITLADREVKVGITYMSNFKKLPF